MKDLICLLLCNLLVFSSIYGAAQDQKKKAEQDWVVELKTVLVELRAVVTDSQGHLVQGLKKEDFELREKGRLQDISSFAEERVGPMSISQRVTVANVAPNDPPPPEATPARSLMLFVDTVNMAGSNLLRVKQSLKKFIDEQVTDQDTVMVVTSGGMEGIPARFTRERNLLRHYINKIAAWGSSANNSYFSPALAADVRRESPDAISLAIKVLQSEEGLNPDMLSPGVLKQMCLGRANEVLSQAAFKRNSILGTFRAAADLMSKAPGQRLMFFFSDGFSLLDSRGNVDSVDLQQAISKAVRSGTVVFSINSRGLQAPLEIDASRRGPTQRAFDPAMQGRLSSYASASEKDEQDGMNAMAKDTGGDAFFRTNDVNWALKKSFEGNNIYYALAYYPSTDDQGFRDIVLRVKGHPEYTVRTQKGYLATDLAKAAKTAPRSPQHRLFDAIARPIPETTINVSASAHYLEVESDKAQVSIRLLIDGSRLRYNEAGDRSTLALEVAGAIYDRAGRLVTSFIEKIKGGVPSNQLNNVKGSGFSYTKRMELKPGYYQVRVGALESETENIGTANASVEVPDLSKGKLELSSVLLANAGEAQQPVSGLQQLDAIKAYKTGSTLIYYLMLYNSPSSVASDLTIRSEIVLNDKIIYESEPQPVASRMVGKDNKGIEIGGQLNLDLEPGFYTLRVEIKDKSNREFRRSVEFLVQR
jgi:VWFA-related protein